MRLWRLLRPHLLWKTKVGDCYWHRPELAAKKMKGLGNKKLLFVPSETRHSFTNVAPFIGAFAELRKTTSRFGMFVRPSAWNNSAPTWVFFEDLSRNFKFHYNLSRIWVLYTQTNIHVWPHLAQFILEWEMLQTKVVDNIKTQSLCSITCFRKSCRLWNNVEK